MLKDIKDLLKTMGDALTFAGAEELLSEERKVEILARHKGPFPIAPDAVPPGVVLADDEELPSEEMEHAIGPCLAKKAQ